MRIELLVTGDELLDGRVADSNSSWFLSQLSSRGLSCARLTMVGDDPHELFEALEHISSRADLLLVSGGLGPTADDLSVEVAAKVAKVELVRDEGTLKRLRERWHRRGKKLPAQAEKQALLPRGAEVLVNEEGTAPGFRLRMGNADCWFFAGVPHEYRHLCQVHLFPHLEGLAREAVSHAQLRVVGLAEAEVDALLAGLANEHGVSLGFRAVYPETHVNIRVKNADAAESERQLESLVKLAAKRLGPNCYSTREQSLPEVVAELCNARSLTLAVAESCTGGMLGASLTEVPGSSSWFLGGAQVYSNAEKVRALGVSEDSLLKRGAVSEQVAREMAEGIRLRSGASHALSITGIAGPGGGSAEKPVGTVWIGLSSAEETKAILVNFPNRSRERVRQGATWAALDVLRRELIGA